MKHAPFGSFENNLIEFLYRCRKISLLVCTWVYGINEIMTSCFYAFLPFEGLQSASRAVRESVSN